MISHTEVNGTTHVVKKLNLCRTGALVLTLNFSMRITLLYIFVKPAIEQQLNFTCMIINTSMWGLNQAPTLIKNVLRLFIKLLRVKKEQGQNTVLIPSKVCAMIHGYFTIKMLWQTYFHQSSRPAYPKIRFRFTNQCNIVKAAMY